VWPGGVLKAGNAIGNGRGLFSPSHHHPSTTDQCIGGVCERVCGLVVKER